MSRLPKFNEIPIHFVTTNIIGNSPILFVKKYCDIIVENLKFYRKKFGYKLLSFVIIPWHLHLLLNLDKNITISKVIHDFKSYISQVILEDIRRNLEKPLKVEDIILPASPLFQKIILVLNNQLARARVPEPTQYATSTLRPGSPKHPLGTRCTEPTQRPGSPEHPALGHNITLKDFLSLRIVTDNTIQKSNEISLHNLWQEDFYDFNIYTKEKLDEKIKYIEQVNPVKHGLVTPEKLENYKWSSFRSRWFEDNSLIEVDYLEWW